MLLPTFVFSENVIFYFSLKYRLKYRGSTTVLFGQSTEYRYRGTFIKYRAHLWALHTKLVHTKRF